MLVLCVCPHLTTVFFLAHINIIVYCDDSESYMIATFVTPVKSCLTCIFAYTLHWEMHDTAFRVDTMPIRWKNQQFTALFCLTLRSLARSLVVKCSPVCFLFILWYRSIYLLFVPDTFISLCIACERNTFAKINKTKQESCIFHQMWKFIWLHLLSFITNGNNIKCKDIRMHLNRCS